MKKTGLIAACLTIGAATLALAPALAAQAAPQAAAAKARVAISLANWTLRDKAGHVYTFGTFTLKAHASVKIHTGHGANTAANLYWRHSWYIWNNDGDTATLKTAASAPESRCAYSDPSEVRSSVTCSQKAIAG